MGSLVMGSSSLVTRSSPLSIFSLSLLLLLLNFDNFNVFEEGLSSCMRFANGFSRLVTLLTVTLEA